MSRDATQGVRNVRSTSRRRVWLSCWIVYLLLLAGSHAWQLVRSAPTETPAQAPLDADTQAFTCTDFNDAGPVEGPLLRVVYREWSAGGRAAELADREASEPLILIHGSPGSGNDFVKMGPLLAARGTRVLAPDLPGFGDSTRRPLSYSTRAHARAVLALMDHLHIDRAHVLGWSMGGGVVLNMADIAPERVASITMLAAIGDQSVEASGSHFFEHAKYTLGRAALLSANAATPSFGLLGDPRDSLAYSTLRNFGDTDMRPLRAVMQRLRTPTLIIAGRDDFLVHLRAPRLHHRLIRPSRLVVMDAMHFMPFLQADETSRLVHEFLQRDAKAGAALQRSEVWNAPERTPPFGAIGRAATKAIEAAPWWGLMAAIAIFAARRPFAAGAIVAALINALLVDWAVGLFAIFVGVLARQMWSLTRGARAKGTVEGVSRADWERRFERSAPGFWLAWRAVFRPDIVETAPRAVGSLGSFAQIAAYLLGAGIASAVWTFVVCLPLLIIAALIALRLREYLGWSGTALSLLVLWLWARSFPLLFSWTGRRMLLARLTRLRRHEYWPSWLFYAPLVPWMLWLSLRHRHPLAFSACNPGIERGGGLIGESKCGVLSLVQAPQGMILDAVLIEEHESPHHRARAALAHIGDDRPVGTFPVIVKPDAGQRGFAVRLVRRAEELESYFAQMTRAAMLQRYHAGPHEVGVLWARDVNRPSPGGIIYSITRKDFPFVVGDGKHTLEQLIYRHPRHRCQADTFLIRLADDASRVVPAGEPVRLAQSGNHCQGTLFRDGADLVTPELVAAMDRLSLTFPAPSNSDPHAQGGLDIGRFDLRFESEDDLRAGRNFGIIELNGTTGESTNLYDPQKSLLWAYRVLFGQWRLLYELGAWRRSRGVRPWTLFQLLRSLREFYRDRPGSSIAD